MPSPKPRTLEDLRHAPTAAWLWDGARGRIVWANAAGVRLFDGQSVFDLVDRPFDARESGVARIKEINQALNTGDSTQALLHFPSTGLVTPLACTCTIHALADGRPGLLVVMEAPRAMVTDTPAELSRGLVEAMPQAVAICDDAGKLIHGNGALRQLVDLDGTDSLASLLVEPERAARLLGRVGEQALASSTETIKSRIGPRDVRLTAFRTGGMTAIVLEDITDRRALERQLERASEDLVAGSKPALLAKDDAFEKLAQSLKENLGEAPAAEKPARPIPVAPAPSVVEKPAAAKVEKPMAIPDAIRASLENSGVALIIGRGTGAFFATTKAADVLELADPTEILLDHALWDNLTSLPEIATRHTVKTKTGQEREVIVSRSRVPWLNGAADQFILRRAEANPPTKDRPTTRSTAKPATVDRPEPGTRADSPSTTAVLDKAAPAPEPQAQLNPAPPATSEDAREAIAADDMRAILDVATDGIITLDRGGRILSFSAGAEAIFGYSISDVIDRPLVDFLSAESGKSLRDYLAALNGPGLASVFNDGREVSAIVRQGGSVPLFLTIGRLQSPRSRAAYCAVVRDITPWKQTEKDLREAKDAAEAASRQKSDFLAHVSHELRTPLNAIMGFSEVMRLERFGELRNEKYKSYANDIHASGAHLLDLVNDLLDLAKVEAGKLELNFAAVSLADVVDHAITLLREEAKLARVVIRVAIAPGVPRVVADLRTMRQIVINLLSNAVKYTDAGGQVIIGTSVEETGGLTLRIKDSGIGMSEAQLRDALAPFQRVDTPDRTRQGTGLGLPLTKALIEANRASFRLSSESGKGTLAEVRFPGTRVLAE